MFIPHVIVRNLIASPQSVTITIEYPGEKGPQQAPLASLALGPYSTQDVPLDLAFGMLPLPLPFCSIRIQYSGPPGSAIAEVSSVETKGDLVIDSRVANERDGWAGAGGHPWHLDEETESIMFLTNMGERPARIGFDVVAAGTHYYLTRLKLQPHETQAIDLRKLRDEQKADLKGNKIPAGAADGSVIWSRFDNVPVMGRLVVLQRHKGISSNYDCGICDCADNFTELKVDPDYADVLVDHTVDLSAQAKYVEHCNSYFWWGDVIPTWFSLDTGVATVDESGTVTGHLGGTATIRARYTDTYYTWSSTLNDCVEHTRTLCAYAGVDVQEPTSLSIVPGTDSTTAEAPCTTGGGLPGCGVTRTFDYQVNDQNGHPITVAGMQFGDVICNTPTNQLNLQSYNTTCGGTTGSCWGIAGPCGQSTDSSGRFHETLRVCAPACKTSGVCVTAGQTIANQTWTVAGQTLSSDVKSVSYQCNRILVNGN